MGPLRQISIHFVSTNVAYYRMSWKCADDLFYMHEHSSRFVICYPDLILSRTMCVCERVCVRVRVREERSTGSAGRPIADTLTRRHANDRTTIPLMTELFCKLADHFDVTLRALACRQDGRKTETALKVDVLVSERVVDG